MREEKSYWQSLRLDSNKSCPNVSLFRFLGQNNVPIEGSNVIDYGFGANHAADLIEMHRRGAKICYGVDINSNYVDNLNELLKTQFDSAFKLLAGDMGSFDYTLLPKQFNLVYTRDTINYLDDDEISYFFHGCRKSMVSNSFICTQFVETDIKIPDTESMDFSAMEFSQSRLHPLVEQNNPIRYLSPDHIKDLAIKQGFSLVANKTHIQSFASDNKNLRVDKYLLFNY